MRTLDLPLDQAAATRFLPWITGGLFYLSVLALAVAAIADGAAQGFGRDNQRITATLPTPAGTPAAVGFEQRQAILELLQRAPGVAAATPLAEDARLVEIVLAPNADPDLATLQAELRQVAPGTTISVATVPDERAVRQARFVRAVGSWAGIGMLVVSLVVVGLTTRQTLRMLGETVELLRGMGAQDGYLARQFERHALFSGVRGGTGGFVLAAATILAVLYGVQSQDLSSTVARGIRPVDWILLGCIPVIGTLLFTAVARFTALWGLARMR